MFIRDGKVINIFECGTYQVCAKEMENNPERTIEWVRLHWGRDVAKNLFDQWMKVDYSIGLQSKISRKYKF